MRSLGQGNGTDGIIALGSYTQTWYSQSGISGQKDVAVTGTFSAGDRVFLHQTRGTGAGICEDNQVVSYVAGTLTLLFSLENTYTDSGASQAQIAVVKEASSVTGSYTVPAWDGDIGGGFRMACNGSFLGTVNASEKGFRKTSGLGQKTNGKQGEGSAGAGGTTTSAANGSGGGGGKGGGTGSSEPIGGGGGGGNDAVGTAGGSYNGGYTGTGGIKTSDDTVNLISLGGGGGLAGAGDNSDSGDSGNGGGFIYIDTNILDSSASLTADGENGTAGTIGSGAGSGSGAGGTIKVNATTVSLGTITADGGATITNTGWAVGATGGAGANGLIKINGCSITGTTSPTASQSTGGHDWCSIFGGMI